MMNSLRVTQMFSLQVVLVSLAFAIWFSRDLVAVSLW